MRILVSSCLLWEDTRYDGLNSSIALNPKFRFAQKELFMDIMCENEIFSICPEVAGGLGIPRNKAEIKSHNKPFIVIDEKDILNNMHEAYQKLNFDNNGYGVFISGPSKTADIEQSLVIGAHGPKSGYVIFTKSWYNC